MPAIALIAESTALPFQAASLLPSAFPHDLRLTDAENVRAGGQPRIEQEINDVETLLKRVGEQLGA